MKSKIVFLNKQYFVSFLFSLQLYSLFSFIVCNKNTCLILHRA